MSEVDTLLDATLDDLEDLPEFKPFPPGAHKVAVTLDTKEVTGHPSVEMTIKGIETLEVTEPTKDEPIEAGAETSVLFMLDNEFGLGNLKKVCSPIAAALGTQSIRELIEQTNDVECIILSSVRVDKNDKDKFHMNVKELQVV